MWLSISIICFWSAHWKKTKNVSDTKLVIFSFFAVRVYVCKMDTRTKAKHLMIVIHSFKSYNNGTNSPYFQTVIEPVTVDGIVAITVRWLEYNRRAAATWLSISWMFFGFGKCIWNGS